MSEEVEEFAEYVIAKNLILAEGEEPEFLSIMESVQDWWTDSEFDEDDHDGQEEMANDILKIIRDATIKIIFAEPTEES